MQRFFLLPLLFLTVSALQLSAQTCEHDLTLPDSVAVDPLPYTEENPMGGITDTACVNTAYESFFQINLPETVIILNNEVNLNSATVPTTGGVLNLPSSFNYACNPPDCVFTSDTVGCIVVYGEAVAEDLGVHDLKIAVTLDIGIPYNTQLPDPNIAPGNYYLHVQEEGSPNCATVDVPEIIENAFEMRIQPNPLSDYAEIFVQVPQSDEYQMTVYNAMGVALRQQEVRLGAGENYIPFDGAELPVGMYIFVLQNETEAASGRLLIQR